MSEVDIQNPGAIGTADETKRLAFEVVRPTLATTNSSKRNPRGRTRRLTLRVFIRVCHLVEEGWSVTKACESESITYSLFRLRCSENPRLEQRIKDAEAVRFQRRHEEALESVMRAGQKSWMAHAWFLERTLPFLYSLKNVQRSEGSTEQPIFEKIPLSQLAQDLLLAKEEMQRAQQLGGGATPTEGSIPAGSVDQVLEPTELESGQVKSANS